MEYETALRVGRKRAEAAAALLHEQSGLVAQEVRAVRELEDCPSENEKSDAWVPVGKESFVDIAVFPRRGPTRNTLLLIVDQDGFTKACTWDFLNVKTAVRLAQAARLPVSRAEGSQLRELLEAKDSTETVRACTLRMDV